MHNPGVCDRFFIYLFWRKLKITIPVSFKIRCGSGMRNEDQGSMYAGIHHKIIRTNSLRLKLALQELAEGAHSDFGDHRGTATQLRNINRDVGWRTSLVTPEGGSCAQRIGYFGGDEVHQRLANSD
jgi:hypothetical protein